MYISVGLHQPLDGRFCAALPLGWWGVSLHSTERERYPTFVLFWDIQLRANNIQSQKFWMNHLPLQWINFTKDYYGSIAFPNLDEFRDFLEIQIWMWICQNAKNYVCEEEDKYKNSNLIFVIFFRHWKLIFLSFQIKVWLALRRSINVETHLLEKKDIFLSADEGSSNGWKYNISENRLNLMKPRSRLKGHFLFSFRDSDEEKLWIALPKGRELGSDNKQERRKVILVSNPPRGRGLLKFHFLES